MLSEPLLLSVTTLLALGIVAVTMLTAWQGWLQLKLQEIERRKPNEETMAAPEPQTRIELADVKERLRRLEAIAAGVDL